RAADQRLPGEPQNHAPSDRRQDKWFEGQPEHARVERTGKRAPERAQQIIHASRCRWTKRWNKGQRATNRPTSRARARKREQDKPRETPPGKPAAQGKRRSGTRSNGGGVVAFRASGAALGRQPPGDAHEREP